MKDIGAHLGYTTLWGKVTKGVGAGVQLCYYPVWTLGKPPPARHIRACTRSIHRDPTRPSLSTPNAPLSAVLDGPSRMWTACNYTPSRDRLQSSGLRSEMRYYIAYITPLSTGASLSPT